MSGEDSFARAGLDLSGDSPPDLTRADASEPAHALDLRRRVNRTSKTPAHRLVRVMRLSESLPMNIDALTTLLRDLVLERQALRDRGATADEIEANRLEIVRVQWQLSYALTELHSHELDRAA
jgi:hypothetical protein